MIERPLWLERVQRAWARRPIIWLSGVRRVGKTTIARMLPDAVYMNCDLPSSVRALEDPELLLGTQADDAQVQRFAGRAQALDTGFVTSEKGWASIRSEDRGLLWEHLVLDSLRFHYADDDLYYWQDKSHREIDFVIRRGRNRVDVVECKINPDRIDAGPIEAFRALYPAGDNYVISPAVRTPTPLRRGKLIIKAINTGHLPV